MTSLELTSDPVVVVWLQKTLTIVYKSYWPLYNAFIVLSWHYRGWQPQFSITCIIIGKAEHPS